MQGNQFNPNQPPWQPQPQQPPQYPQHPQWPQQPPNYRRPNLSDKTKAWIAISVIVIVGIIAVAYNDSHKATPSADTQSSMIDQTSVASTPTVAASTSSPTQVPTKPPAPTKQPAAAQATQKPLPAATQPPAPPPPTQPPAHTGVNGNPWGYDFNQGNFITNPPLNFCDYFACIKSFWNGVGHVEECQDTMYSLSGGIRGSCSYHGGDLRPLYSH